tara:strand:+ start:24634 stop:24828 length:195 start_codon:yes stop_codon:yes gene_type:complete
MSLLMKIWQQNNLVKWLIYFAVVYILFLIKEAFAILLWALFAIMLYFIIFAKNLVQTSTYYEKQ